MYAQRVARGAFRLARVSSTNSLPVAVRCCGTRVQPRPVASLHSFDPIPPKPKPSESLGFDDGTVAFASRSTGELMRAALVLRLCAVQPIVDNSRELLELARKVLGDTIVRQLLRQTIFGHFCAGEDAAEIVPRVKRLQAYGVGSILDFAAEADLPPEGTVSEHDETECDKNAEISMAAIEAAAQHDRGFAAIKLTSLGKPALLHHISAILHGIRRLFRDFVGPDANPYLNQSICPDAFVARLRELGFTDSLVDQFESMDKTRDGTVDYLEWIDSLDPKILGSQPLHEYVHTPMLSPEELTQLDNMFERMYTLVETAKAGKVRLMIDAEQTYMQPAIDHIVMHLQRKYNRGDMPTVFGTYQAYLTDCESRMRLDMMRARREGFTFACKLVRGAYLVSENKLALEKGYKSPVHGSLEATHACYRACTDLLMDNRDISEFLFATHNEDSVRYAVDKMDALGIPRSGGGVYFGQLLGMCDPVSFALGAAGYEVFKYIPYGPVFDVVPYLIRRAEENSGLLGSAAKERRVLKEELVRRIYSP